MSGKVIQLRRDPTYEPWLSKKQIGAYYGVSGSTIDNWSRDGMPYEYRGGYRKFRISACEEWHSARSRV